MGDVRHKVCLQGLRGTQFLHHSIEIIEQDFKLIFLSIPAHGGKSDGEITFCHLPRRLAQPEYRAQEYPAAVEGKQSADCPAEKQHISRHSQRRGYNAV